MNLKKYDVVLLNDDEHSYSYVCCMLNDVFGLTQDQALQKAKEVDSKGEVILYTGYFEHAEYKASIIDAYGPDQSMPKSNGSMKVDIRETVS